MRQRVIAVSIAASAAALIALTGCGSAHNHTTASADTASSPAAGMTDTVAVPTTATAPRTVDVSMAEYQYAPTTITVKRGETVSFHFTNDGKLLHEAFIGTEAEQEEHDTMMSSESSTTMAAMDHSGDDMAGMDHSAHGMDDANMLRVAAGASGDLVHTFDTAGTFIIGCHQVGHWAAGMRATVVVA